jgi:hypothetical protein
MCSCERGGTCDDVSGCSREPGFGQSIVQPFVSPARSIVPTANQCGGRGGGDSGIRIARASTGLGGGAPSSRPLSTVAVSDTEFVVYQGDDDESGLIGYDRLVSFSGAAPSQWIYQEVTIEAEGWTVDCDAPPDKRCRRVIREAFLADGAGTFRAPTSTGGNVPSAGDPTTRNTQWRITGTNVSSNDPALADNHWLSVFPIGLHACDLCRLTVSVRATIQDGCSLSGVTFLPGQWGDIRYVLIESTTSGDPCLGCVATPPAPLARLVQVACATDPVMWGLSLEVNRCEACAGFRARRRGRPTVPQDPNPPFLPPTRPPPPFRAALPSITAAPRPRVITPSDPPLRLPTGFGPMIDPSSARYRPVPNSPKRSPAFKPGNEKGTPLEPDPTSPQFDPSGLVPPIQIPSLPWGWGSLRPSATAGSTALLAAHSDEWSRGGQRMPGG